MKDINWFKVKEYIIAVFKGFLWLYIAKIIQKVAMLEAVQLSISYSNAYSKDTNRVIGYNEAILNAESAIQFTQLVSLFIFGLLYIICQDISKIRHKYNFAIKSIRLKAVPKLISLGIILNIIGAIILAIVPKRVIEKTQYSTNLNIYTSLGSMVLCVGILVPICEELIFRYFIFNSVKFGTSKYFAILFSSLLFAIAHGNPIQQIYTFIYGVVFVTLNIKYNSILPSIILHIVINTTTALLTVENTLSNKNVHELLIVLTVFIISTTISIIWKVIDNKEKNKSV